MRALCAKDDSVKTSVLVEELNEITPGFDDAWSNWLRQDGEFGEGESPCEHDVFLEFNQFVLPQLNTLSNQTKSAIFVYVESALTSADENLSNAVATCFLESLVQRYTLYKAENAFPFLGPKSRAHCKAWDEFNGVKTEGLW